MCLNNSDYVYSFIYFCSSIFSLTSVNNAMFLCFRTGSFAETISHDLSTDVSSFTGDSAMYPDDTAKHVASRLRNGQQNMKSEKVVGSYVILRPNTSFKVLVFEADLFS
jgi:hypothetical protein